MNTSIICNGKILNLNTKKPVVVSLNHFMVKYKKKTMGTDLYTSPYTV